MNAASRRRHRLRTPVLVATLATLVIGAGIAVAPVASARTLPPADEVTIDTGKVRGKVSPTRREFLGIPFAEPTTGQRRFRAPQPVAAWSGTRDATKPGAACSQPIPPVIQPSSEDCLSVDVHTPPATSGSDLPVLVWIYGGAYVVGSNSGYDPAPLVAEGNVVVALNYRLGPFGFLSLPGLDAEAESGTSGDFALMDQQAGLRWVQRNVAAFGGDPDNVTIFGESAGGNSVCHQIASPHAAGLFRRAIVQSGSCAARNELSPVTKAEMRRRSRAFAQEMGCTDRATEVACLRALPQEKLLSSETIRFNLELTWVPSVDGFIVPRSLDEAWRTGNFQKVPMIVGTTRDEGRTFVGLLDHALTLSPVSPQEYESWVRDSFGDDADAVLAKYPVSAFDSADLAKAAVLTDSSFTCPTVQHITLANAAGSRIFAYELNDVDPPLAGLDPFMPLGNFHASDVLYLFNSLQGIPAVRNATQQRLSDQMVALWSAFARTGRPGAAGGTKWTAWTPERPKALELNSAGNRLTTAVPDDHNCDFWKPIIT